MKTITINVSEPVYEDIKRFAEASDRTASEVIRQAMEEFRDRKIRPSHSLKDMSPYSAGSILSHDSAEGDPLDEMLSDLRS